MTKKRTTSTSGRPLAVLAVLGALAALWALFLWTELASARSGGTPFCGFADDGDCGALWDAAFAGTVHRLTGLPVAAWGVVWGLGALLLPLAALAALADGRGAARPLAAVRWTAAAGAVGVVVMLLASAVEGLFCTSCAATYVLTLAYAGVAFFVLEPRGALRFEGWETALAATAGVWLLLLYPGLHTPKSVAKEEQRVLAEAAGRKAANPGRDAGAVPNPGRESSLSPQAEQQLAELIGSLNPQMRQGLSDSLAIYRASDVYQEAPRVLHGSADAPVRITEFTDALCSHCANLHATLNYLRNLLPPESFSVDSRQFPLDGNCNDKLQVRGPESVRCLASRARVCLEDSPQAFEAAGAIFERQEGLTPEGLYEAVAPFVDRAALEACVASSETARKLAEDVEYAWHFEPHGTPLVLINGREGPSFGPFLYAMVLTGGADDHPLFADLPPPHTDAHMH